MSIYIRTFALYKRIRDMITELQNILDRLVAINDQMKREEIVYRAELNDRLAKGLTGDEAIKHYNEWMLQFNMDYLCVK